MSSGLADNPIRIANCSGFYGDRLSAAAEMVEDGPIDVLTGDWLAELTMLILARSRAKRPGGGFARTFVGQMEQVMGSCLDKGIKVVSNAGGLDPDGCAEAVAEVAAKLGLSPTIAYVTGDNLLPRMDQLRDAGVDIIDFDTGKPVAPIQYISANAYLGCWGIVEALNRGADIVITGRTTDAAVVCGPAAWHHGWERQDWDALAGAVVAGHVIECGTQATGGNYSFFDEIGGLERAGFPFADIAADGSSTIGKHANTGGAVNIGTVTSQLLYEIGAPAYLGPDVTARFDTISLAETAHDRVQISGTRGVPPPATLKVSMTSWGGFRSDIAVALTGIDIEQKAALVEAAFWRACPFSPEDYDSVTTTVARTDKSDPATNSEAVASLRITLKDSNEDKVKAAGSAVNEMALATVPGYFALPGGGLGKRFGVHTSGLIDAALVPQEVVLTDQPGNPTVVDPVAAAVTFEVPPTVPDQALAPTGRTRSGPLGLVVGTRSGDKGGNANLGVFARSAEAYAWLDNLLSVERLRTLLPETQGLDIERYALPNIWSLNFVIVGLLQKGVASSTRQDGQAKGLGEWLRSRHVDIPVALLGGQERLRDSDSPANKQGLAADKPTQVKQRIRAVPRPQPILSKERAEALTARQRKILDDLTELALDGFGHLTMADIAANLNCSLRTLYGLAPNRGELVLMAFDRNLWTVGREANRAATSDPGMGPLEAIGCYLAAANQAVSRATAAFSRDLASVPGGSSLGAGHNEYLVAITRELLDYAVELGHIEPVDTAVVARAMASLGAQFSDAAVVDALPTSPKRAADEVIDLILRGLTASADL